MKRVLSVVLCALAVVCLAACGGGDSKNPAGEYKAESPKDTYGNSAELVKMCIRDRCTAMIWRGRLSAAGCWRAFAWITGRWTMWPFW